MVNKEYPRRISIIARGQTDGRLQEKRRILRQRKAVGSTAPSRRRRNISQGPAWTVRPRNQSGLTSIMSPTFRYPYPCVARTTPRLRQMESETITPVSSLFSLSNSVSPSSYAAG